MKTKRLGRNARARMFALITLLGVLLLFGLNLLLTHFGRTASIFADTTPEGLYTLSDRMVEECSFLDGLGEEGGERTVRMIFCTDPDYLAQNMLTRAVYFMALQLHRVYPNFRVEMVNVVQNPTAVAAYKTTSLSQIKSTDVIVAYGSRYRIVSVNNFWTKGSTGQYFSFNGEYRLASLLMSVTAIRQPSAYFITDHGETCYDPEDPTSEDSIEMAAFADLLAERGLTVRTLNLSEADGIPADCALLIINNPTRDFTADSSRFDEFGYISDAEKIDRYLVNRQGALMVSKDYRLHLPVLEDYLREWGFAFHGVRLRDETASMADSEGSHTNLIATYNTDSDSFAHAIYGDFADLSSAPRTVIPDTGYISCSYEDSETVNEPGSHNVSFNYSSFLTSSAGARAYAYSDLTGDYTDLAGKEAMRDLAAVSTRLDLDNETSEYGYSYVFCTASPAFFSNALLSNASYANFDIVSALVNNISRSDAYASMDLGGTSLNSSAFGGKQLVSTDLSNEITYVYSPDASEVVKTNQAVTATVKAVMAIVAAAVPLAIAVCGAVVRIRRRYR